MNTNGSVTQNGFGAGGGDGNIILFTFYLITQVVKLSGNLFMDNLFVGNGCLGAWVPVNHSHTTID